MGKFASLRPKNVRKLNRSHREYCVCPYCINIRFKLLTISRATKDPQKKRTHERDLFPIILCPKGDNDKYHKPSCISGECTKCKNYQQTLEQYYKDIPEHSTLTWSRQELGGRGGQHEKSFENKSRDQAISIQRICEERYRSAV